MNGGLGDVVISRDNSDGAQPRFAQDFYYLTLCKVHSLHGYRKGRQRQIEKLDNAWPILPDAVFQRFVKRESVCAGNLAGACSLKRVARTAEG